MKELNFKIHANLYNEIVRDAYWFENRKKWALDVLRCLDGITFKQEHEFLTGNAIFKNTKNTELELVYEEDKYFKRKLQDKFFGDGKMKVPLDRLEKANFSGWLTREGFFIQCKVTEHADLSQIICAKLQLLKEGHCRNYERVLELSGAIKISSGNLLYELDPSGKQVDALIKYIKDGGHLNNGAYRESLNIDSLLDWLGVNDAILGENTK